MKIFKVELGQDDYPDDMFISNVMVLACDIQDAFNEIGKTIPRSMFVASIVPIRDYNYVICSSDAVKALSEADLKNSYNNRIPLDD